MNKVIVTPVCTSPINCMLMESYYNFKPVHLALGFGLAVCLIITIILGMFVRDWIKAK